MPSSSQLEAISPCASCLTVGVDVGVEAEIDQAAIVMHQLLHLGIHRRALVVVGLGAGLEKELVEARILPEGVVPGRVRGIGDGEHPVAESAGRSNRRRRTASSARRLSQ